MSIGIIGAGGISQAHAKGYMQRPDAKIVVEAIVQGRPSPVPADTFLYTNLIFDGLYESSRLGREVPISLPE